MKNPADENDAGRTPSTLADYRQNMSDAKAHTHVQRSPKELVAEGVSFLTGLTRTLQSPEATRELVDSIVETDKETGETHLKIAVLDKESVVQVLGALDKIFMGMGK